MFRIFLLVVAFFLPVLQARKSYSADKVFSIHPTSTAQVDLLLGLQASPGLFQLDFWSAPAHPGNDVRVHVLRKSVGKLKLFLRRHKIAFSVEKTNIEEIVHSNEILNSRSSDPHTYYMRHAEINDYLEAIAAKCGSHCSTEVIGQSYEGRSMKIIKFEKSASNPILWIDAGIHAREWIAPATAMFLADKLSEDTTSLLNTWSVYILPVANPDGYEYTHTSDRFWRKTRSPQGSCRGVDGNRNFGYKFGGKGTSSSSCSDIFRGREAFSEQEVRNIRDFVLKHKTQIKSYWAVHSYGQYWLHPYGYDYRINPSNVKELRNAADVIAAASRTVNNRRYTVGHSADLLYPAAGAADDWAISEGIPYSYTLELPDTGRYGFLLPPTQIISVGEETLKGLRAFLTHLSK